MLRRHRFLRAFAHAGADNDHVVRAPSPQTNRRNSMSRFGSGRWSPFSRDFEKAFDRFRGAYANLLGTVSGAQSGFRRWISCPFASHHGCWFLSSAKISFLRWMRERFDCTCARRPARGSNKPPSWLMKWKPPFVVQIPANEMEGILDNIGLPVSGINLSYNDSGISGPADARHPGFIETQSQADSELRPQSASESEPRISWRNLLLPAGRHRQPNDLTSDLPAPLDIQVVGRNETVDQQVANSIAQKIRQVRGAVDVRVQQPNDLQRFEFNVDRTKAMELGLDRARRRRLRLARLERQQPGHADLLARSDDWRPISRQCSGCRSRRRLRSLS